MYESFWKLDAAPFENRCRPEFYFPAESHQAALLKLRYAIEHRLGAALLTGGVGYGKSNLVQTLASQLSESFSPVIALPFPRMSPPELLAWLAVELGVPLEVTDAGRLDQTLRHLESRLRSLTEQGQAPTIVIDEAHLIESAAVLQTFQLLMNYQQQPGIDFTLVFVGDRPLLTSIGRHAALDERISIRAMLQPLNRQECEDYITHRLSIAGRTTAIFDASAYQAIFELTGGIPRRINRICDLALLVGYADQLPQLTGQEIEAVSEEMAPGLTV